MLKIKEPILQEFMDKLVEAIEDYNNGEVFYAKNGKIDIPYIISSLYQDFCHYPEKFTVLVSELKSCSDYSFEIAKSQDDWYGYFDVFIYFYSNDDRYDGYYYKLKFTNEERHDGYCECVPGDPDYREDKRCCGHGCDAVFCKYQLVQVTSITSGSWDGDEHDFWDFEEEFLLSDEELKRKIEKEERENRIESLEKQIKELNHRLEELRKEE